MVPFFSTKMTTIQNKKNFSIKKLKKKYVILNEETGRYLFTNESGKKIIDLLDTDSQLNKLVESFSSHFEIDIKVAENDVIEFVKNGEKLGIFKIKNV